MKTLLPAIVGLLLLLPTMALAGGGNNSGHNNNQYSNSTNNNSSDDRSNSRSVNCSTPETIPVTQDEHKTDKIPVLVPIVQSVTSNTNPVISPPVQSSGGNGMIYCSGPLAPGWNVSLPNGGCATTQPVSVTYTKPTPTVSLSQMPYTGAGDSDGQSWIQILAEFAAVFIASTLSIPLLKYIIK